MATCGYFDEDQTIEMKEGGAYIMGIVAHFSRVMWHHLSRPILEKKTDGQDLNQEILL